MRATRSRELLAAGLVALLLPVGACSSGRSPGTSRSATTAPGSATTAPGSATTAPGSATTAPASPSQAEPTLGGPWSIVALGDSVPAGGGCDCTPYPELSAASLTESGASHVSAMNEAVGGYTTSSVLNQLTAQPEVQSHVAAADVVEIEAGANDVAYSTTCGTTVGCYEPTIPKIEENLGAILSRVHALTQGRTVLVVLLDYWSVWLGGAYAEAKGAAYVEAASVMTDEVNAAIRQAAAHSGSAYVDLRAAFKGPDYAADETHYLAPDGDHPNAAGHQQISAALVDVIRRTLHHP